MSETNPRSKWDHHVGMVLAVLGAFILLVKFKIHTLVFNLWPLALIFLGWQIYRRADDDKPARAGNGAGAPPPPPDEPPED